MRHRLIAAALPVLVLVAACGARSSATVHASASYRIFLQEGFPQQITVINSTTGAIERQLTDNLPPRPRGECISQ